MIFPTICNLERVAPASDYAEAIAIADRYPIEIVGAWVEERDGERWICIQENLGYPVTSRKFQKVERS